MIIFKYKESYICNYNYNFTLKETLNIEKLQNIGIDWYVLKSYYIEILNFVYVKFQEADLKMK